MNRLPKSWCIYNEGFILKHHPKILEYINKVNKFSIYRSNHKGSRIEYYGINLNRDGWVSCLTKGYFDQVITVEQFYEMTEEFKPKKGDIVEVKNCVSSIWVKRIFLAEVEGEINPYRTVSHGERDKFPEQKVYGVGWKFMRKPKDTIEIDIKINGKSVSLADISEETLFNIRKNER